MTGAASGYDFFLSRRGSVASVAQEVSDVLTDEGYSVLVQDYDIPLGASFVEAMHDGIRNSRDLVVLLTHDYEASAYTRKEFTSFEARRLRDPSEHHVIILRCEDISPDGLLADNVFQDLVGVFDPAERRRRIMAAVRRETPAERKPIRPFIGVPPAVVDFAGRADTLDLLDDILRYDSRDPSDTPGARRTGRAVVVGAGGLGKTSLSAEYVRRYRAFYAGILWCAAESRTSLVSSLAMHAEWLGGRRPTDADRLEAAAEETLRRLGERRGTWLLVYDNVPAPDAMADLVPPDGTRLLVTSRSGAWSGWAEQVTLDGLHPDEAVGLLKARSGRSGEQPSAAGLAEALGCFPLALEHAAAFCRVSGATFSEYRSRIAEMVRLVPQGARYGGSIYASVGIGYDTASTDAKRLLHTLAFLAPDHIRTEMLAVAVPDLVRRVAILESLSSLSLVLVDGTKVLMHRLSQEVVRQRFDESHAFDEIRSDVHAMIEAAFVARQPALFEPIWELLFDALRYDPDPKATIDIWYPWGHNSDLDINVECRKDGDRMWVTSQVVGTHGHDHHGVAEYRLGDRWEQVTLSQRHR